MPMPMPMPMSIRLASKNDAKEISDIVISSAETNKDQDFDPAGWQFFVETNGEAPMRERIADDRHFTLCY